jgi:hypothetical protein
MGSRNLDPLLRHSLTVKDFKPTQMLCEYVYARISLFFKKVASRKCNLSETIRYIIYGFIVPIDCMSTHGVSTLVSVREVDITVGRHVVVSQNYYLNLE